MKIIFRYGEADVLARMRADQMAEGVKTRAYYPECGRGQIGQRAWVLDRVVLEDDVDIISSSNAIFDQLRLCVAQGLLKPEELNVYYYEKCEKIRLGVFPSGHIDRRPADFMNEDSNIARAILAEESKRTEAVA